MCPTHRFPLCAGQAASGSGADHASMGVPPHADSTIPSGRPVTWGVSSRAYSRQTAENAAVWLSGEGRTSE